MNSPSPNLPEDQQDPLDSALESEILVGRIVDGEATLDDRRRFELLADVDPKLWRKLAVRQQDMAALTSHVEESLQIADRVELPHAEIAASARRGPWLAAVAGWAAMIVVACAWGISHFRDIRDGQFTAVPAAGNGGVFNPQSPDEHLREYMHAPFVLGELPPTLLQVETLSDGRVAVRFLRRIEEVTFIESDEALPVDESGNLTKPPSELRTMSTPAPNSN